jgi:hypothetical protein
MVALPGFATAADSQSLTTGCWVGSHFTSERIIGEYFWMWFTALVSLGLYVPLFFCLRGNIMVDENRWSVQFRRRPRATTDKSTHSHDASHEDTSQMSPNPAREALIMLLSVAPFLGLKFHVF